MNWEERITIDPKKFLIPKQKEGPRAGGWGGGLIVKRGGGGGGEEK